MEKVSKEGEEGGYDSDSSNASSEPVIDLSQPNMDRSTKKTLRERLRRRVMNQHLTSLRRLLKVDESKDKKSVLLAVIDFLESKQREREMNKDNTVSANGDADASPSALTNNIQSPSPSSSSDQGKQDA